MTLRVRRAEPLDLPEVETLLKRAELPPLAPHPALANLLVAELDDTLVGAVALDVSGRAGLITAIVVDAAQRGRGVGRELARSLMARAAELGLKQLYAVASGAEGFFAALGFEPARLDVLPALVRESRRRAAAATLLQLRLR